ncbi:hypothetical protein ACIA98_02670 [Streptomyces sp. NPDC051366]|uniref:hypothetical protein n=1 Tax=Streptomyces sp. NPDC051366 TaxID=3365652 RepID=UPI0037B748B0
MADSSANIPGHSPGARIQVGDGTCSLTLQCLVSRFGAAYMVRVGAAEYSQWSPVRDACSNDTWDTASIGGDRYDQRSRTTMRFDSVTTAVSHLAPQAEGP